MADGSQTSAPLNGAQILGRAAATAPADVAVVRAGIGQPALPGQAALIAPDAAQAQAALFIPVRRINPFVF